MTFAPPLLKMVSALGVPVIRTPLLVLVISVEAETELRSAATWSSSRESLEAASFMRIEPEPPARLVVSLRAPLIVSRLVIVALLRSMMFDELNPTIVSLPPP